MPAEEDEYELVPLSPIRKMEKRLERLERGGTSTEMMKELLDVVRTNQQIVDDMVKMNSELVSKITDLAESVNSSIKKIDEFMSRLEVEKEEGGPPTETANAGDVDKRVERLEKRINSLLVSAAARRGIRLRRPVAGLQKTGTVV